MKYGLASLEHSIEMIKALFPVLLVSFSPNHFIPGVVVVVKEDPHHHAVVIKVLVNFWRSRVLSQCVQLVLQRGVTEILRLFHFTWDVIWVENFNILYSIFSPIISSLPLVISLDYLLKQEIFDLLFCQRLGRLFRTTGQFRLSWLGKLFVRVLDQVIDRAIVQGLTIVVWGFRIKSGMFWRLVYHST